MKEPTGEDQMDPVPTGNINQLHGIKNSLAATHGGYFMMRAKVLQVFRKTNNTIYGYRIQVVISCNL